MTLPHVLHVVTHQYQPITATTYLAAIESGSGFA